MKDVVFVFATICLYFGGAVLVTYCLFWYIASKQANPGLSPNSTVKLVGPGGSYRCHFLRQDDEFLVFSNPLQADRYIPIRVGEKLMVSAAAINSFVAFRSEVIARDAEKHELSLRRPNFVKRTERRSTQRLKTLAGEDVLLEGEPAEIIDHSSMGICVLATTRPSPAAVVRVSLPAYGVDGFGWAIESAPAAFGRRAGYRVHIQFQEEQTFADRKANRKTFVK